MLVDGVVMRNVPVIFSSKPEGFGGPVNSTSPRSKLLVKPEAEGSLAAARLSTAEGLSVDLGEASRSRQVRARILSARARSVME